MQSRWMISDARTKHLQPAEWLQTTQLPIWLIHTLR